MNLKLEIKWALIFTMATLFLVSPRKSYRPDLNAH